MAWEVWIILPVSAAALIMLALNWPAHSAAFVCAAGLILAAGMSLAWPETISTSSASDGALTETTYVLDRSARFWPAGLVFAGAGVVLFWLKRIGGRRFPRRIAGLQVAVMIAANAAPAVARALPPPQKYSDLDAYIERHIGIVMTGGYAFLASLVLLVAIAVWTIARRRHAP